MEFFYYPKCKIGRADRVLGKDKTVTLYVSSSLNTPKHYPQHELLKGKPLFFVKIEIDIEDKKFTHIFPDITLKNLSKMRSKEISIIIKFDPHEKTPIEIFALGKCKEVCSLFLKNKYNSENTIIASAALLNYKLEDKPKKKKIDKI